MTYFIKRHRSVSGKEKHLRRWISRRDWNKHSFHPLFNVCWWSPPLLACMKTWLLLSIYWESSGGSDMWHSECFLLSHLNPNSCYREHVLRFPSVSMCHGAATSVLGCTAFLHLFIFRTGFPPDVRKDHPAQRFTSIDAACYTLCFCLFWVTGRAAALLPGRVEDVFSERWKPSYTWSYQLVVVAIAF